MSFGDLFFPQDSFLERQVLTGTFCILALPFSIDTETL